MAASMLQAVHEAAPATMDVRGALRGQALREADVNGVELEGVGASS
jgi:hypothetical protein